MADHRFEKRAQLLATRIKQRMELLRDAVTPPGERPPFSVRMTQSKAMEFWSENRYTPVGQAILAAWKPEQVGELDAQLSEYNAERAAQPSVYAGGQALQEYQTRDLEPWMQ